MSKNLTILHVLGVYRHQCHFIGITESQATFMTILQPKFFKINSKLRDGERACVCCFRAVVSDNLDHIASLMLFVRIQNC